MTRDLSLSGLRYWIPVLALLFLTFFNLWFEFPNPYEISAPLGWLSDPSAESNQGGHCSLSIGD